MSRSGSQVGWLPHSTRSTDPQKPMILRLIFTLRSGNQVTITAFVVVQPLGVRSAGTDIETALLCLRLNILQNHLPHLLLQFL
jgi:hypothetical protein